VRDTGQKLSERVRGDLTNQELNWHTDNGFSVPRIVAEVFALNVLLAALALFSIYAHSAAVDGLAATTGAAAVAFLLYRFSRKLISS